MGLAGDPRSVTPPARAFVVAALLACAFAALACETKTADAPAATAPCRVGDLFSCDCAGDESGNQVCLQDGTRGPCVCAASASSSATCVAGAVRACRCEDGRDGEQVCLASGGTSRCLCESSPDAPPQPGPALPSDAGTTPQPEPPVIVPEICCGALGTCLPTRLIPDEAAELLSDDDCDTEGTLCVPDVLADPKGARLQPCRAPGGIEGRCLPACLPDVQAQSQGLVRDLCERDFLCVPCFDPYDGSATGVCELGADPGPLEDPVIFGGCCDGVGRCVPASLVPEPERASLPLDGCDASRALLCAPEELLAPDGFTLQSCRAIADLEGRCVAECLLAELGAPDGLTQASCPDVHRCVPCFDPFSGAPSGACTLGNDPGPAEPAEVYARCCDVDGAAFGTCVPASVLPEAAAALPQDSCASAEDRCLPDSLRTSATGAFAPCSTLLGGAGGCLPRCMVPSPQFLIQGVCAASELCVPCTAQGAPTGACQTP